MILLLVCALFATVAHRTTAATVTGGPFGWSLTNLDFNDPDYFYAVDEFERISLNCSFSSRFRYGVLGWIRCPIGSTDKKCRTMWIPYDDSLNTRGIRKYDDQHESYVIIKSKKDSLGDVLIDTKLHILPKYEDLGGHACVYIPLLESEPTETGSINEHALKTMFFITANIRTETLWKRPILRATFSVSKELVPHISSISLLRMRQGLIHTIGRFSGERMNDIKTKSIDMIKKTSDTHNVFSLTANITAEDTGFAFEIDDGEGGLIARTHIHGYTKRTWKFCELMAVFVTIIMALATVILAVPNAEKPFACWCALCIGWLIRGITDTYV